MKYSLKAGEKDMAREINPNDTTRSAAYTLWMNAPNPMVTFFKTLDVSNLVKVSKKKNAPRMQCVKSLLFSRFLRRHYPDQV